MKTILIIEDDQNIRESISDLLNFKNFNVLTAIDGNEGFEIARKSSPDLILCDIMMPGKDGYQVLNEVRDEQKLANTPFIFLTAKSQKYEIRNGMNLGADDYLTKPFKAQELFDAIESRLTRQKITQSDIDEKLQILRPLKESELTDKLIHRLEGVIDSSSMLTKYFDSYSKDEIMEMINGINKSASATNRKLRNIIWLQSLKDLSTKPELIKEFTFGSTSGIQPILEERIIKLAKKHNRINDLFLNIHDGDASMPKHIFSVVVNELLDNAFRYSAKNSLVKISTFTEPGNYRLIVKNKITQSDKKILEYFKDEKYSDQRAIIKNQFGIGLKLVKKLVEINQGIMLIKLNEKDFVTVNCKI